MKKWEISLSVAALTLLAAAGALAEEGVRVTGSKLPYLLGGIGAIALGLLITIGMVAGKETREVIVLPNGLPIPIALFPVLIGVVAGIALFNTTPKDAYTLGGMRYRLGKDSAAVVGLAKGEEAPEVLIVPAEVEGLPVVSVGGFAGTAVREAVLPCSLRNISSKAFKDCASLETVRFEGGEAPDEDKPWLWMAVGDEAFSGCGALKNLSLSNAGSIGDRAFMNCASLERAELPGVYAGVGSQAFSGCGALRSVTLSADIRKIGAKAFEGCEALESVRLEGGEDAPGRDVNPMTNSRRDEEKLVIEARAFENCAALKSVDFPPGDNTKSIGERAFAGCASLDIEIPAAHLEKYCFEGCASLRSVATNSVWAVMNDRRTVPEGAFRGCSALVVADLKGIDTIGPSAFEGCTALRQVTATWAKKVGKRAFADCPALEIAGFGEETLKSLSRDAFEGSGSAVLCDGGDAKVRKLGEAAGVKAEGGLWFACEYLPDGSLRLTDCYIGDADVTGTFTVPGEWIGLPVSAVGLYREYRYTGHEFPLIHEEIIVEEGVKTLEEDCFRNWKDTLRRVYLPDSLQTIEPGAVPARAETISQSVSPVPSP